MLHKIVDNLITNFSFSFQDTVAGIAQPVKKNIAKVQKTFPVYYKDVLEACETDNLQQLVPDGTKKSIIYFEVINQPTVTTPHKEFNEFTATIRLVCWVNYKKIADIHDPSTIVANILDGFPQQLAKIDFIAGIRFSFLNQVDKSILFTPYTYKEAETQFMTYPYDAFGLDFEVLFRIGRGCSEEIIIAEQC